MKQSYKIEGMTCGNCVRSVRESLTGMEGVERMEVQLSYPQLILEGTNLPAIGILNKKLGKYRASEVTPVAARAEEVPEVSLATYKPLLLVIAFILLVSVTAQYPWDSFSWTVFMRHFMAGFFIAFAFFKFLDLRAFADSFAMYDVIASRMRSYGYLYPFIELTLGLLYLAGFSGIWLHASVVIFLGLGTIGVVLSNLQKRKIKCACLGTVFNLPMSQVTIIENTSMILMALLMMVL